MFSLHVARNGKKNTSSFNTVDELTAKQTKFLDHFKDTIWRIHAFTW